MSGKHSGLRTLLQAENSKALYLHCYAHSLQLAIQDAVRSSDLMNEVFDLTHETAKLIRNSPRRTSSYLLLKQEIGESSVGIRQLCPTRYDLHVH